MERDGVSNMLRVADGSIKRVVFYPFTGITFFTTRNDSVTASSDHCGIASSVTWTTSFGALASAWGAAVF